MSSVLFDKLVPWILFPLVLFMGGALAILGVNAMFDTRLFGLYPAQSEYPQYYNRENLVFADFVLDAFLIVVGIFVIILMLSAIWTHVPKSSWLKRVF